MIGLMLIIFGLILGLISLTILLQDQKEGADLETMELVSRFIYLGFVLAGLFFMVGKPWAVFIAIVIILSSILFNLLVNESDTFDFLMCLILPLYCMVYLVRSVFKKPREKA